MSKLLLLVAAVLLLSCLSASVADASPLAQRLAAQMPHRLRRMPTTSFQARASNSAAPLVSAAAAAPMSFGSLALHQLKSMGSLSQRAASLRSMHADTAELSTGAIVGIIIAAIVVLFLLSALCCYHRKYIVAGGAVPMQGGAGTTVINTGGAQPAGRTVIA